MGLEQIEELKRKPIELNLSAARKRQSAQTGYVHYCCTSPYALQHDTIPLLENFCFVLALFRSRTTENIAEGKKLLQQLMAFEVQGHFPVYLHEYPQCRDRLVSIHILPVIHWILEDFKAILNPELKTELAALRERIIQQGLAYKASGELSKQAEAKLLAASNDPSFLSWEPQSAGDWGHYFQAWQMLGDVPFPNLAWNDQLYVYTGVNKRPYQEKEQPALSLLDLYMGASRLSYATRALQEHPTHLQAALVQPFSTVREKPSAPFALHADSQAELPFTLWWGDQEAVQSLACTFKKNGNLEISTGESAVEMTMHWNAPVSEDPQEQAEILLFLNDHPAHRLLVNGLKATAFQMNDSVEIHSGNMKITCTFSGEQGDFFGHIARSNRPYQRAAVGNLQHESYDYLIALRTVRRPVSCAVKVQIRYTYI